MGLIKFTMEVPDYEHEGDFKAEIYNIKLICPQACNFHTYEERDYECEEEEYDDPVYRGYIDFEVPEEYKKVMEEYLW